MWTQDTRVHILIEESSEHHRKQTAYHELNKNCSHSGLEDDACSFRISLTITVASATVVPWRSIIS